MLHFQKSDIIRANNQYIVKSNCTPLPVRSFSIVERAEPCDDTTFKTSVIPETQNRTGKPIFVRRKVTVHMNNSSSNERISTFGDLTNGLEERKDLYNDWNLYTHPNGICFYRIECDELFDNVEFALRILINKNLAVQLVSNQGNNTFENNRLESWSQLKSILENHSQVPLIDENERNKQNVMRAVECLQKISLKRPEIDIDIQNWINKLQQLNADSEKLYVEVDEIDENQNISSEEIEAEERNHETIVLDASESYEEHIAISTISSSKIRASQPPNCVKCEQCWRLFLTEESMLKHMDRTHQLKDPIKCEFCNDLFMKRVVFRKHARLHDKPYNCTFCKKTFMYKAHLYEHVAAHTEENIS